MRPPLLALLLLVPVAAGCGRATNKACTTNCDGAVQTAPFDLSTPDLATPGANFHFVLDQVVMPNSAVENLKFLYDVDGNGSQENKLAQAVNALITVGGVAPQTVVDMTLKSGALLQLLQVTSTDPALQDDNQIAVSGFVGKMPPAPDPAILFGGSAMIDVDLSEEPPNHTLDGTLAHGHGDTLHLPPGAFPLHLPIDVASPPVHMTLYAAHASFDVQGGPADDAGGPLVLAHGMLNGGLSETDVQGKLIPAIANMLNGIIQKDPTSNQAQQILRFFDALSAGGNNDGMIEPSEVANNDLVANILDPDLDLFDANGNFAPNQDHVKESLSLGVGFNAVGAVFPDQN
jgi:hypothetical protein